MRNSGRGGHRVRPAGGAGARQRLAVLAAFLGLTAWATAGSIVVQNDPVDGSYGTCILVNNGTGAAYPVNSGSVVIPYTLPATFTLTATAGIGREFVQWKGTAVNAGIVGAPASANTSMTPLVDTTYTLVCDFRPKRTLSMFSDGNHITMSPAAGTTTTYDKGAVVPIQTAPQLNYAFRFWGAKDNATPHPAVTNPLAEASSVVLEYSQEVRAYFSPVFSLRMFEAGGPGTASVTYSNLAANSIYTAEVPQPIIQDTTRHRYQVRGWINGNGDIPSTGTGPQYGPYNVSQSSQMRWQWDDQWRLLITASGGGTTSPGAETNYWYDNGETVTLVATPDEGYVFLGWFQGGTAIGAGTLGLLMTNSYDLTAVFVQEGDGDLDNDGMSDVWEVNFGLDPSDASGINGASGDPDADGLLNIQEFLLQQTNGLAPFQYASPINADTDGDGMDDYYERFQVDQETVDADPQFVPAALHPGGGELGLQKGPGGNPDGDAIWNTTDGYENTNNWLRNIQEWTGPDGIVPLTYENVAPGATASDGWNNPLSVTVRRAIDNPSDTGDQSSANAKDSDGDSFDDGFEYTWDLWQQANDTNEEVFVFGVRGDSITNAVPDWATDRRFNPAVLHVDAAGVDGAPDYDVLYDYETGGVSASWYSDALEYGASEANAFSADIAGAPKSIVRSLHPTWRRCSHPFYIDVDQDGLPDGYEVIFGTDPWAPVSPGTTDVDADKNPDADFMAFDSVTTNVHDEVYQANGYDPRVAWGALWPKPNEMPGEGLQPSPTTRPFSNLDEARGADGRLELMPRGSGTNITEDATSPVNEDSDADGMWDGWELYVGLDPNSDADAAEDVDDDGLDALAEFQSFVTSSMDRDQLTPLAAWMNKVFPTDPNAVDTDGDGLSDGREQGNDNAPAAQYTATVIVSGAGVVEYVDTLVAGGGWTGRCYAGGGLNPCSADTENDGLPDSWEATYSVMHGTISDQWADPDHDRLRNYEEYRVGATYHWQWDAWLPGQPVYRASDFFQGEPKAWDWYSYFDWDRTTPTQPYVYIPFLSGPDGISPYSTCHPGDHDSDEDGMDDYWEIYHGLDPVYGIYDLVLTRVLQLDDFAPAGTLQPLAGDPRLLPWVAGTPGMDPDNDGLVNDDEGVGLSIYGVPSHQTDPSPIWFTDALYPNSFTSLYYVRDADVWYWTPRDNAFPPSFAFDFEINEGYDTDKDFEADYDEVSGGSTDPTSEESPLKRRALYLPSGQDAYARTQTSYHWDSPVLRSFTVEAWVRPSDPATGEEQTIVERPFMVTVGNSMLLQPGIRFNFRLAVDGDGLPFVEYNGNGQQIIFVEAKAGSAFALKADEWTHLAGTYILPTDTARGRLVLYVNGEVAATFISDEIPAHGTFGTGGTVLVFFAPLVIGASDLNPSGEVSAFAFSQPSPTRYFSGWVDEVRVWDGARSQADVQATMMKHMRRSDLFAATSVRTTPLYVYSFDDLGDPDLDGVAPEGYSAMASASAPLDWPAIPFWAGANDKSLQYTEYRYLPVFANAMEHYPEVPPLDVGDTNVYTVTETVVTNTDSTVSTNVTLVMKYQNTANPYGLVYESSPLGGDYDIRGDLLPLRWAVADADVTMWDGGGAGTDDFDSDGDGLPDGWEEAYGMNPLGDAGADGAYGDPDQDGLVNIDEFEAGVLSPVMFDTLGNGYSDFYAWSGSVYRIFGELLTDVDGMADEWERLNALDPNLYDANQDADDDGWSNLAEFYAQTDPHEHYSVPQPSVQFLVSYTGLRSAGNLTINAYSDPDMDGPPDAVYDMSAIPSRSVYDEYIGVSGQVQYSGRFSNANIVPGSVLISHQSYRFSDVGGGILVGTWPGSSGTVDYSAGAYTLVFETPAPAGWNMSASYRFWEQAMTYPLSLTFTNTVSGYIREGDNWFFAYVDRNGDGTWNEEEPAGVQELRPFHVGWDAAYGIEIGLTDELPGYGRFSWEPVQDAAEYKVVVRDRSMPGSPLLFPARTIRAPRTYVHEQDFWQEGFFEGLGQSQSGFEWFVYRDGDVVSTLVASNSFVMLYDASLPAPTLVWPVGAKLAYARNEFRWRMDPNVTRVQVQISRESSFATRLMNVTTNAPFREVDGTYRFWLPTYAGYSSLTNGSYYWRVQASTPRATSAWSTASSFMVDLQDRTDGPYSVSGALGYFGKVTNGYFNVQAFRSRGWSGVPEAQVRIANTSSATNWPLNEFDFRIPGLKANTRYYVRAFLDQDGDRILDDHESRGFAEETYYEAKELQFPPSAVGIRVPVSLVDTDNDKIADDWEYQYFGDLLTAGPGPVNGYTDYDNNGISDYESYAASPMNISPMNYNSTGADGIPYWAKLAFNLDPWEYYGFLMTSIRPGVGGMPVVCWEAVGGSVQGMANGEALCVNNGVTVHYRLQYSPDLLTWSNVTSVNPVVYNAASGAFEFTDAANTNRSGFYRLQVSFTE